MSHSRTCLTLTQLKNGHNILFNCRVRAFVKILNKYLNNVVENFKTSSGEAENMRKLKRSLLLYKTISLTSLCVLLSHKVTAIKYRLLR